MFRSSTLWVVYVASFLAFVGCAYPRRTTSLSPVTSADDFTAPRHVWGVRLVSATIPPLRPGGLPWDDDGSLPDVFVRLYRGDQKIWQSQIRQNTLSPAFNESLPQNVWLPPGQLLRIEIWDEDSFSSDPLGVWKNRGLPISAMPDTDHYLRMESDATVVLRLEEPKAHRGIGIARYEIRKDAFRVLEVLDYSPAGRAGIRPNDRIVAIEGKTLKNLGETKAASALSLLGTHRGKLRIVRENGRSEDIVVDGGYVWITM